LASTEKKKKNSERREGSPCWFCLFFFPLLRANWIYFLKAKEKREEMTSSSGTLSHPTTLPKKQVFLACSRCSTKQEESCPRQRWVPWLGLSVVRKRSWSWFHFPSPSSPPPRVPGKGCAKPHIDIAMMICNFFGERLVRSLLFCISLFFYFGCGISEREKENKIEKEKRKRKRKRKKERKAGCTC